MFVLTYPPAEVMSNDNVWVGLENPDEINCPNSAACVNIATWSDDTPFVPFANMDTAVVFSNQEACARAEKVS